VADGPCDRPSLDAVDQGVAFDLCQLLGVTDLVETVVLRDDDGADRERPGPRPPANLVESNDGRCAVGPQGSLVRDVIPGAEERSDGRSFGTVTDTA